MSLTSGDGRHEVSSMQGGVGNVTKDLSREMGTRRSKAQHQEEGKGWRRGGSPTNEKVLMFQGKNIVRVLLKRGTNGPRPIFNNWYGDFPVAWTRRYPWSCRVTAGCRGTPLGGDQLTDHDRTIHPQLKREDRTFWVTEGFRLLSSP